VINIAKLLEVDIDSSDISVVIDLKLKTADYLRQLSQNYISEIKDGVFQARSKLQNNTSSDLGYSQKFKLYVNESLTPKARELFKEVKGFQKDYKFKFAWTKYGRSYLKKLKMIENQMPFTAPPCLNLRNLKYVFRIIMDQPDQFSHPCRNSQAR
jgi:hypothetical protein